MKLGSVFALYLSCILWFNTTKSEGIEEGLVQVLNPQLFSHFGDITKTVGTSGSTAYKVLRTVIADRIAKKAISSIPGVPTVPAVPVEPAVPVLPVVPVQSTPVIPVQETVPVQVVETIPVQPVNQLPLEPVVACPPTITPPPLPPIAIVPPCPPSATPPLPPPTITGPILSKPIALPPCPPPTISPYPPAPLTPDEVVIIESTAVSTVSTPRTFQPFPVTEVPTTVRPTEGPIIVVSPSAGPTTVTCPLEGPTSETVLVVGPSKAVVPVAPPTTLVVAPAPKPCHKKKICLLLEKKALKYGTGTCVGTDKKCLKKAKKLAKLSKLLQKKCIC